MRLIDADAVIEKLKQHHDFFVKAWGGFKEMPRSDKARCDELSNSIAEILNAPSIDICFCRECKYAEVSVSPITGLWCTRFGINDMAMEDDDFCSYGQRKESE